MAFNPIEYLKNGNVDFIHNIPTEDKNSLIKRIRNNSNRNNIIIGFLYKLIDVAPSFCFEIIYDMNEFKDETLYLLEKYNKYIELDSDEEKIDNILKNTTFGKEYVLNRLDIILNSNSRNIYFILDYIFLSFDSNKDLIKQLYLHPNLHVRYIFMKYVIEKHGEKLNLIYDDIMKYLTSYTHKQYEQLTFLPELMTSDDISLLAWTAYKSNNKELWLKLKEYIFANYESNNLGQFLLQDQAVEEFRNEADILFITSKNYKLQILRKYSQYVSNDILEHFRKYVDIFKTTDKDNSYDSYLSNVFYNGLGQELITYIDKYLSLSKETSYEFIKRGSTASCYRIGDYAFKLNLTKWSYEDIISPNIYLILKNLEEHYIRCDNGVVSAGIEVQKYLTRKANDLPIELFGRFESELKRLGYYSTDTLIGGNCGDNCMLLDSYKEADCYNPELLPEWFKEIPLVLIDRDRIYQLENKRPKQLSQRFS